MDAAATMKRGFILFAHGARDARWAAPFEAIASRLRALDPGAEVRLAFLEFMPPTLPEAGAVLAAAGCTRIDIVPLFLGAGGHVQRDLPLLVQALRGQQPVVEFVLHPAAGEQAAIIEALARCALELGRTP